MNGVELITAERQRQIDAEGWTPEHDDEHLKAELIGAARAYAFAALCGVLYTATADELMMIPDDWPTAWDRSWWKPSDDPIRNLVKAGALIAAEIDRLQREEDADRAILESRNRKLAIDELKKQPVSDPERFIRCDWCGMEMLKGDGTICDDCCPF